MFGHHARVMSHNARAAQAVLALRCERMAFAKYPPIAPFHGIEEFLGLDEVFGRRVKRGSETVSVRQLHLERLKVIVPLNAS